jgi:hypothetical protein
MFVVLFIIACSSCKKQNIIDTQNKIDCSTIKEGCNNIIHVFKNNESKKFNVELSSTCIVTFSVENAGLAFKFVLRNALGKVVVNPARVEEGSKQTLIVGPLEPGTFALEIIPYSTISSGSKKFEFFVKYDCSDQTEPNNTFAQATSINSGAVQQAKILAKNDGLSFEDFDLYKFNIPNRPAVVKVELQSPSYTVPPNSRIRLSVLNSANSSTQLEYLDVYAGQTGTILLGPLSVGDHYIGINGTSTGICNCESEGFYKLTLNLDQSDLNEPNDFANQEATNMKIDEPYKGSIVYPNGQGVKDVDWFKFVPLQSGKYQIQLIGLPTAIDTYAYIYTLAPNGNNYNATIRTNNAGTSVKDFIMDAGKEYWIRVELGGSSNESSGLYNLRIIAIK